MKKLLRNSVFRILIVLTGNFCLFYFLFAYIIPHRLTSPLTSGITIALFGPLAVIFTLTMLCDLCYDEASKHLVVYGNLSRAKQWMKLMHILDLLHWYDSQYCVFLTVYYQDTEDYEQLRELLKKKVFRSNRSMELVYHYGSFLVGIHDEKNEDVVRHYDHMKQIYEDAANKKDRKAALIYSLPMITAQKDYYFGKYKEVSQDLNKVFLNRLNQREQSHYYYLKYRLLYGTGQKKAAIHFYDLARKKYPQGRFLKEMHD